MSEPSRDDAVVRTAVLRDYPLRLWAEQQEHVQSLLREFQLLLAGDRAGTAEAPRLLVELAAAFTARYGALIDRINDERLAAFEAGRDRMDSQVPMPEGTPALLAQVRDVMAAVDAYCRSGDMLLLPRGPELLALAEWTERELVAQYGGAEPVPWTGPF